MYGNRMNMASITEEEIMREVEDEVSNIINNFDNYATDEFLEEMAREEEELKKRYFAQRNSLSKDEVRRAIQIQKKEEFQELVKEINKKNDS